ELVETDTHGGRSLLEELAVQQRLERLRRRVPQVLEVHDDVQLRLTGGVRQLLVQLRRIETVQGPLQLDQQRRELFQLARLDAEELVHLAGHLLQSQQGVRDRIFHLHRRDFRLQALDDAGDRRERALRAGPREG